MMTIADMDLDPVARDAAELLLSRCPEVVFTSGRRHLDDQARAMAQNVALSRNWIGATYKHPGPLRNVAADHPELKTAAQLEPEMLRVLVDMEPDQLLLLTRHFAGLAFDVMPMQSSEGLFLQQQIRALPHLDEFLTREGGMVRWHVQFHASAPVFV